VGGIFEPKRECQEDEENCTVSDKMKEYEMDRTNGTNWEKNAYKNLGRKS
jgi:hypothetical protein